MTASGIDLAARLVVGLVGPELDPRERAWLTRWRPAGVILFGRNVLNNSQLSRLCRDLHTTLPGLEIVADQEGGPVSVLAAACGRPPAAATLGLLDDPDLTRRVHAETARAAADAGVDRLLAPVADVLCDPRNPVIGTRAFGADAASVARHVAAAVAGLLEGGVRCCVKHWPGHGGTAEDSHLGEARDADRPPDEPFAAAAAAGADAAMVAHVAAAGADGPASLAVGGDARLRALAGERRLTIWADDLTMGALRAPLAARGVTVPPGDGLADPADLGRDWIAAVAAGGCDRLLVRGIPWGAFPTDEPGPRLPSGPAAAPSAGPGSGAGVAHAEARARLAALFPAALAGAATVAWIDRTAQDRWGPLAGGEAAQGARGLPGVTRLGPEAASAGADGLLVTSHRPLDRVREAGWARAVARAGVAVGVGHPSLAADLRALLPAAWRVSWLPEWPDGPAISPDQKI